MKIYLSLHFLAENSLVEVFAIKGSRIFKRPTTSRTASLIELDLPEATIELVVAFDFYRFNDRIYPIPVRVSNKEDQYLIVHELPAENTVQTKIIEVKDPAFTLNMNQEGSLNLANTWFSLWSA